MGEWLDAGADNIHFPATTFTAYRRADFSLPGLAVLITQRDVTLVAGQDVFLLYHAPIQIMPEVNQCLSASSDRLAVHHPLGGISVRQFQSGLFDARLHFGAEYFRQCFVFKQLTAVFVAPQPPFVVKRGGWHHQMHMRVIIQPTVVGVQHGHSAGGAAQFSVIPAERVDGLPCAAGDQVIHHALLPPGKPTELGGQGKRYHEVIAVNQLLRLLVHPALRLMRLTMRAVAMSTGMRQIAMFGAVMAGKFHPGAHAATANSKGTQCRQLAG